MKYNFSFLILLFALINLSSCSEDEDSLFNLIQVSGILYEKKINKMQCLSFQELK